MVDIRPMRMAMGQRLMRVRMRMPQVSGLPVMEVRMMSIVMPMLMGMLHGLMGMGMSVLILEKEYRAYYLEP